MRALKRKFLGQFEQCRHKIRLIFKKVSHWVYKCREKSKLIFKRILHWLREYWQIILYSLIAISLIAFIISMIIFQRMQEIDAGMKYLLYPIYMLTAIVFGTSAKFIRDKKKILIRRREIDSRWATFDEMKKRLSFVNISENEIEGAGIPIISDGQSSYVDSTESHSLLIGSTGSGKTRRIILPLISFLLYNGESVIVTDPKGELFDQTSGAFKENGYKVVTLNFRDPEKSDCWNPLAVPYQYFQMGQIDKAMEMINDIALNIMYDDDKNKDPFWEQSAVDYFIGLALGLCEDASPEQITLNNISYMNISGQESYPTSNFIKTTSNFVKEYFMLKNKYSNAYTCASGTIEAPDDTRASIISVFQQKLRVFTSQENLSQMLSHSNFLMKDIGTAKTVVYIIIQDEKSTYHPLATAFIKQCYEVLIDCATKNGGKLPVRTNFILDEYGNLPPIIDMTSIVSAARSRNIRLTIAIQSNKQLDSVYGESDAEVIKNNCNNLIFLYGRDLQTLKEISELCGNKEEQLDFNVFETKPLITTSQLQHLHLGETIFITKENYPYKTKLPDFNDYTFPKYPPCEYNERPNKDLVRFDIQNFVKEKKQKKLMDSKTDDEHLKGFDLTDSKINSEKKDVEDGAKKQAASREPTDSRSSPKLKEDSLEAPFRQSIKDQQEFLAANDEEIDKTMSDILCDHYFTKAFDAYKMEDYETAEKYFTKVYYLGNDFILEKVKNNLAYMKRRGETKSFTVSVIELLHDRVEENDVFALINLALCYIDGFEVKQDYAQAFTLIRRIKDERQVLLADCWWGDSKNCGEAEMKLVTFLLRAAGKVPGASKEELENRFIEVCDYGYKLPANTIHILLHGD